MARIVPMDPEEDDRRRAREVLQAEEAAHEADRRNSEGAVAERRIERRHRTWSLRISILALIVGVIGAASGVTSLVVTLSRGDDPPAIGQSVPAPHRPIAPVQQ